MHPRRRAADGKPLVMLLIGTASAAHASDGGLFGTLIGPFRGPLRARPTCSRACLPQPGMANFLRGCGKSPSSHEASATLSPQVAAQRRVVLHVATCQEDIRWLSCSWHSNMLIRVIHKCTPENPGFHRVKTKTTRNLHRSNWTNPARPQLPCMQHLTSHHLREGRESEVFLGEISDTYDDIRDDDVHVFLQGGYDEFRRYNYSYELAGPMISALPRRRDVAFASLTPFVLSPAGDANQARKCDHIVVKKGRERGALDFLHCDFWTKYAASMRATFAVSGRRIRETPHATWTAYHRVILDTFKNWKWEGRPGEMLAGLEEIWPLLFRCCWAAPAGHDLRRWNVRVGYECYEGHGSGHGRARRPYAAVVSIALYVAPLALAALAVASLRPCARVAAARAGHRTAPRPRAFI